MKVVQIPRKLWVDSYEFPLYLVEPTHKALVDGDGNASAGMTTFGAEGEEPLAIWIDNSLDMRKRLEVVFHEVTHAINHSRGVEDGITEEDLTEHHGLGWSQFWLDNPRFVLWLTYTLSRIRKEQRTGVDDANNEPKPIAAVAPVTPIGL